MRWWLTSTSPPLPVDVIVDHRRMSHELACFPRELDHIPGNDARALPSREWSLLAKVLGVVSCELSETDGRSAEHLLYG